MPRDATGLYTLVTGNPVTKGEPILAAWANPTMDDLATALSDSLDRLGNGPMLAPLVLSGSPTDDLHAANKWYVMPGHSPKHRKMACSTRDRMRAGRGRFLSRRHHKTGRLMHDRMLAGRGLSLSQKLHRWQTVRTEKCRLV